MKNAAHSQASDYPTIDITLASGEVLKDIPLLDPTPEQIAQAGGSKSKAALLALAEIIERARGQGDAR